MNLRRGSTASPIRTVKIIVSFHSVVDSYFQQSSLVGIHRRFPKLLRVHFPEAFVTLNRQVFLGRGQDLLEQGFAGRDFLAAPVFTGNERCRKLVFQRLVKLDCLLKLDITARSSSRR